MSIRTDGNDRASERQYAKVIYKNRGQSRKQDQTLEARTGEETSPMKYRESEAEEGLKLGLYCVEVRALIIFYCEISRSAV